MPLEMPTVTVITRKAGRGGRGRDLVRVTMTLVDYGTLLERDRSPSTRALVEARFGEAGLAVLDAPREPSPPRFTRTEWRGLPALVLKRDLEEGLEQPRMYLGGLLVSEEVLERDPNRPAPRPAIAPSLKASVAAVLPSAAYRTYHLSEEAAIV